MSALKFLFVFVFVTVCLQYITAAPNPLQALQERQDLVQKFAEFLHDDQQFASAFERVEHSQELVRNRRQVDKQDIDSDEDMPQEKPGFFDRAAKFVTELLQRFLKWINSSDN